MHAPQMIVAVWISIRTFVNLIALLSLITSQETTAVRRGIRDKGLADLVVLTACVVLLVWGGFFK